MKSALSLMTLVLLAGQAQAADVKLDLLIKDSKIVYTSYLGSFGLSVNGAQLACRDRHFYMDSEKSLYEGWDPANSLTYKETNSPRSFRTHTFASCRNENTEALAWFTAPRESEYQLIGAVDGDVFADPIRIEDKTIGQFAAAEFQTEDQKSVVVRFEGTTGLDGQIVRINGPEAYCRRLQKQ